MRVVAIFFLIVAAIINGTAGFGDIFHLLHQHQTEDVITWPLIEPDAQPNVDEAQHVRVSPTTLVGALGEMGLTMFLILLTLIQAPMLWLLISRGREFSWQRGLALDTQ